MSKPSQVLIDALRPERIEALALPSNLRYGRAITARGGVEILVAMDSRVEGRVGGLSGTTAEGGGQRRRVEFVMMDGGLTWHCTGNPKDHQVFCKHCVALALALREQMPESGPTIVRFEKDEP